MILYKSCRELPIHNFFEINRINDLSYLVKSGEIPTNEILEDHWLEIIDEYNSLFSVNKNPGTTNKSKLYILSLKLMNLEIVEMVLRTSGLTDEIVEIAKRLKIKPENISSYIAGIKNDLTRLQKEINDEDQNQNDDSKNNGNDLEKTLTLVKENGFNFDRFSTPVIEFVFAITRLEEKQKHYESQNK